jgi:glyoxylase-like metal-dependent hydrolase (beta-lactamase superfamily II)
VAELGSGNRAGAGLLVEPIRACRTRRRSRRTQSPGLTALVENTRAPHARGLRKEHGLSMFIEHAGKRILSDTGVSDAFADNAAKLGVDLASVDVAVISHHHLDHGGGLRHFMQLNTRAPSGDGQKQPVAGRS